MTSKLKLLVKSRKLTLTLYAIWYRTLANNALPRYLGVGVGVWVAYRPRYRRATELL